MLAGEYNMREYRLAFNLRPVSTTIISVMDKNIRQPCIFS